MLEILIKIAGSENRDFLAYLLSMALIEARHHVPPKTYLSHWPHKGWMPGSLSLVQRLGTSRGMLYLRV